MERPGRAQKRPERGREPKEGQEGLGRVFGGAMETLAARKCGSGPSNQALVDPRKPKVWKGSTK